MLEARSNSVFVKKRTIDFSVESDDEFVRNVSTAANTQHPSLGVPDLGKFVENFEQSKYEKFAKLPFTPSEHETFYKEVVTSS